MCFKIKHPSFSSLFLPLGMCNKCYKELKVIYKIEKIEGYKVLSIFEYNEAVKTLLYNLKALGDIELAKIIIERHIFYLKIKYRNYILLPAPSTIESEAQRGFNHVCELFKPIGPIAHLLKKKENFKQSDLSFVNRQEVGKKISLDNGESLRNKKVLIVDDLKTTGATIRAIIKKIEPFAPKKIEILTLAATKVNT